MEKKTHLFKENYGEVKEDPARKKIALEFLHQRLGHRYTRSLIAGDGANIWEDVDLRIYPDLFALHAKFLL